MQNVFPWKILYVCNVFFESFLISTSFVRFEIDSVEISVCPEMLVYDGVVATVLIKRIWRQI